MSQILHTWKYDPLHTRIPKNIWLISFAVILLIRIDGSESHGRLIEPPSRASAWRYGFSMPPDYNDHELYCGGFTRQWKRNDGKCGECGDAWDLAEPRPHEFGGQWGQGLIVRTYKIASEILIRVELTASHMGYFEFRICPQPNAKQDCLDRYLLKIISGTPAQPMPADLDTRFYPRNGSRIYEIKAQLPDELKCSQCVLQWRYIAGNNWGICPDGNGAVGCGPQEEFRACADIALGDGPYSTIRPFRPTTRTSVRPKTIPNEIETTDTQNEVDNGFNFLYILLIMFIILFALAAWYMYRYKGREIRQRVEKFKSTLSRRLKKTTPMVSNDKKIVNAHIFPATLTIPTDDSMKNAHPVPPPRAKRQSRVTELSPNESSVA